MSNIYIPSGFIRVKAETETNYHSLDSSLYVYHKLKPSNKVKDYANEINNSEQRDAHMRLYNVGGLSVYDNEGNLVGNGDNLSQNISDLDKKEYGKNIYRDYDYNKLFKSKDITTIREYNPFSRVSVRNEPSNKQFGVSWVFTANNEVSGKKKEDIDSLRSGTFYSLLPRGTVLDEKSVSVSSVDNFSYEVIPNYKNSGRDLLIVKFDRTNEQKKDIQGDSYLTTTDRVKLYYHTLYSWDAYKDYGPNLRSTVAFESNAEKIRTLVNWQEVDGYKDDPIDYKCETYGDGFIDHGYSPEEKEIMKDLNPDHDRPVFIYIAQNAKVVGNTIATTGLSKFVKSPQDIRYTTKTKVKEGDSYSYRLRLASQFGTSTSNIILYDTLEDYTLLKSDKDYGINTWNGVLESIDVTQPLNKGIDAVVYYSTVPNLKIRKPDPKSSVPVDQQENTVDLTDTSIWTEEKPADLSKVTAIAVDLTKDKNGQPYVLKENESVVVNLHMRAPWNMKEHNIDITDKAINEVYANTTVTTNLDSKSENELINMAYTGVNLDPVIVEAPIKATKKHLDKEGKDIALKCNDFTFELKDAEGNTLQTKTNDNKGNITFDPIKYNSWDVGEYTYKIVEVKCDNAQIDYDSHEEVIKVKVERTGDSELKSTVIYDDDGPNFLNQDKKSASLKIIKKDNRTGKLLESAEYLLSKKDDKTFTPVKLITNKDGESQIVENLATGKYVLKETNAPQGYRLNTEEYEFKITDKDLGTVIVKEVEDRLKADMPTTGTSGKVFFAITINLIVLAGIGLYKRKTIKEN